MRSSRVSRFPLGHLNFADVAHLGTQSSPSKKLPWLSSSRNGQQSPASLALPLLRAHEPRTRSSIPYLVRRS